MTTSVTLSELMSMEGKRVFISGGAGLLGSQISEALAELGAQITIASRDQGKCQDLVEHLNASFGDKGHLALGLDITDGDSVKEAVKTSVKHMGGIDVLINCAWSGKKGSFETTEELDWMNDINVSLNSVFRTIKAAFPHLKANGGVILNVASMYGIVAPDYRMYDGTKYANPPGYGVAKAGVIQLTKYLASFLAPHKIRVNCISPGPFPYESTQQEAPDLIETLNNKNPMGRIGKPHELKGVAALLCSGASSYMTGQNISVDGGWTIW